ncbi:MerR family transcriptional regulator [Paraburkholderia sp. MMS20-SJTN17]|uniref:MerR family transcriptional regulator n=1 Tax=Paraburkholderia translucens TaxID=2886945 RepID=A0ABS8KAC2_9BURK|nr:MerR family transcriptional regulator [Paraburkholderia sp. MMS20-SJTN17]MCC8401720.1 MerR family transcriptional regulator [Paraburkholderia sp. MMS20-SJTN17]
MSKHSTTLTIGEVAETIGVSTHTLRYYEQAGLIRPVGRTQAGHRLYSRADLDWLRFVMRLKATGMSISGMQQIAALRAQGHPTMRERRDLLVAHRAALLARIADLQSNLGAIEGKIAYYEAATSGAVEPDPAGQDDEISSPSHVNEDSQWTTHTTTATRADGTNSGKSTVRRVSR